MLNEQQKKLLTEQGLWWVATASKDGKPNVAVKGTTRVIDESTLVYGEGSGDSITYKNLVENPQVIISVLDLSKTPPDYIRCFGKAELLTSGDLYNEIATTLEQRGRPKPKAVVKVKISEVRGW